MANSPSDLTRREPGGAYPPLGTLISDTMTEFMANIGDYLMAGLGLFVVAMPVGLVLGLGSVFAMYFVLFVGMFGSAAVGSAAGDQDLGGIIAAVGGVGTFLLAFTVLFGLIGLSTVLLGPLSASLTRAIAAHQRGEQKLVFGSAFATATQGMVGSGVVVGANTLAQIVGVFFCYIGAVVPAVLFKFAPTMVFLHGVGPMDAMSRTTRSVMANPGYHIALGVTILFMAFVSAYIPVIGAMFLMAFTVRAYRSIYGDGAEPVMIEKETLALG